MPQLYGKRLADKDNQESLRNSAPNYANNKKRYGNYSKSNNEQLEISEFPTVEGVENDEKKGGYNHKKKQHQGNYNNNYNYYGNNNYNNYGNNYKQGYNEGGYYKNNKPNYNTNYINEEEAFSKVLDNKKVQEEELQINKSRSSKTGGEIIARIDIPKGKTSLKELLN